MEIRIENITEQEINFTWDAVQDADSYRLLWKDRKRESMQFKALLPTKELKGTLKKMPRIPYYVKVQAIKGENVLTESEVIKTPVKKVLKEQLEKLGRGLVAVKTNNGIFVSWRLFKDEVTGYTKTGLSGTDFVLFRNGEKIATVTESTNYLDKDGSEKDVYSVVPFVTGAEPAENEIFEKEKIAEHVSAWKSGSNYIDIPLQIPEGGTTIAEESFVYHANDISVGDVDGDGEYEYIVKWDPSNSHDVSQRGYTGKVYLDCYKLDGRLLWRLDMGINIRAGAHYTQFMVYDFNNDGRAEMALKTAPGTCMHFFDEKGNETGCQYITIPDTDLEKGVSHDDNYVCSAKDYAEHMKELFLGWQDHPEVKNGHWPKTLEECFGIPVQYSYPLSEDDASALVDYFLDVFAPSRSDKNKLREFEGFIYEGPEYLTMFAGDGKELETIPFKFVRDDDGLMWGDYSMKRIEPCNRVDRFLSGVAYLDGERPYLIMCRGYYTRTTLVAYDFFKNSFNEVWSVDSGYVPMSNPFNDNPHEAKGTDPVYGVIAGQGNHSLSTADVDGDGCQEIIYGAACIDQDGSVLYSSYDYLPNGIYAKLGHGDAMHVANIDPDRPGLEIFNVFEGAKAAPYGYALRDAEDGSVELCAAKPVMLPTEDNRFQIDPERLRAAITGRTKAIVLTSPNNPTGCIYTKMLRSAEQDYTLMLWFKTDNEGQGALISNGKGATTDDDARNKFFLGFENNQLIYRTNGRTLPLGKGLADDQWHHFAITVDRSHQVANLYVDRVLTQSISTDTLGGMMGQDFYVGNMVWHEAGTHVQTLHQENALTGHIDELCLFSQALPHTLLKHYSTKCPTGREKGLLVRMGFGRHERQANNNIELRPYALNQVVKFDMDGNPTEQHDSVFVDPVADIMARIDQQVGAPIQFSQELQNLNFSFVGRNNQLLVNIDEQDARINKRNLYVTVTDIPDLNGNYMTSPATMEFFVDRNPLRWQVKRLTHEFTHNSYTDDNDIFTVSISNTSGANHTYTIDNLPRWLTVDRQTDIIGPQNEQLLVFTIAKDLNVGTYDEVIYLTDENKLSEPLALTIRKEGVEPDWYVADELKHFSMNLVGQVKIGNAVVTDSKDKVAAFDSMNRCLGIANVNYSATTGKSQLFMTIFSDQANSGNTELTFKLWHHQTGQVMVLKSDPTVTFNHSTIVGTVDNPVVMTGGSVYYQELNLRSGWNWISLNVDNRAYRDVIGMLNKYKWEDGDIVTDDTEDFTLVYKASLGTWLANNSQKSSYTVSPKRSYRIYVKNNVNIEIQGYPLRDESQRTLTVKHGWNNIGYTPMVNLPVATALADYTGSARNGDVVKSREEFAIFTETSVGGGYWSGSLQYLKPGEGYMLYRNSEGEARFRYPFYEPGSNFFERTAQSRAARADYARNMSVVATVKGIEVQEGDRIIAFANGEQRGEALVLNGLPVETNEPLFFLTIMGDQKVPLSFAIERDGEVVATTAEVMGYESNALSGTLLEPTVIQFVKTDFADGNWYTLQGFKLGGKPSRPGVYIHNGKKQVVK